MPKRSSRKDVNQLAADILAKAVGQSTTDPEEALKQVMRAMGRRGGLKGGKARSAALSDERKAEIAKKAAAARWKK